MKAPAKNISASLKGQRSGGRGGEAPTVGRQKRMSARDMTVPGEGGVSNPPGAVPERSSKAFAGAVGKAFGSTNA